MPSPNFGHRRGRRVDALVLHYTGMADGEVALARLRDTGSEVSSHYLVWEDGGIDQLVAEADRAWHAGRSSWAAETDMNSISIGVEIVNGGHDFGLPPYPPAQIAAVSALSREICTRHAIHPKRVLAHSDIAPDRKVDPGEHFPWQTLAAAGVGLRIEPVPAIDGPVLRYGDRGDAVQRLQDDLVCIGYGCGKTGLFDQATLQAVTAFQRRWCPSRIHGAADAATVTMMQKVRDAF